MLGYCVFPDLSRPPDTFGVIFCLLPFNESIYQYKLTRMAGCSACCH